MGGVRPLGTGSAVVRGYLGIAPVRAGGRHGSSAPIWVLHLPMLRLIPTLMHKRPNRRCGSAHIKPAVSSLFLVASNRRFGLNATPSTWAMRANSLPLAVSISRAVLSLLAVAESRQG